SCRMSLIRNNLLYPDEPCLDRQLVGRQAQRFLREGTVDADDLEHDTARSYDRDPVVRRALARAHPDLGELLRHRLVGKDVDPDRTAALEVVRHGAPRRLDL